MISHYCRRQLCQMLAGRSDRAGTAAAHDGARHGHQIRHDGRASGPLVIPAGQEQRSDRVVKVKITDLTSRDDRGEGIEGIVIIVRSVAGYVVFEVGDVQ